MSHPTLETLVSQYPRDEVENNRDFLAMLDLWHEACRIDIDGDRSAIVELAHQTVWFQQELLGHEPTRIHQLHCQGFEPYAGHELPEVAPTELMLRFPEIVERVNCLMRQGELSNSFPFSAGDSELIAYGVEVDAELKTDNDWMIVRLDGHSYWVPSAEVFPKTDDNDEPVGVVDFAHHRRSEPKYLPCPRTFQGTHEKRMTNLLKNYKAALDEQPLRNERTRPYGLDNWSDPNATAPAIIHFTPERQEASKVTGFRRGLAGLALALAMGLRR